MNRRSTRLSRARADGSDVEASNSPLLFTAPAGEGQLRGAGASLRPLSGAVSHPSAVDRRGQTDGEIVAVRGHRRRRGSSADATKGWGARRSGRQDSDRTHVPPGGPRRAGGDGFPADDPVRPTLAWLGGPELAPPRTPTELEARFQQYSGAPTGPGCRAGGLGRWATPAPPTGSLGGRHEGLPDGKAGR